jgi:hypothetical protein
MYFKRLIRFDEDEILCYALIDFYALTVQGLEVIM